MMKRLLGNNSKNNKNPILTQDTLNGALKSLQQIINAFEVSKNDIEQTKLELQQCISELDRCKNEYTAIVKTNKSKEDQVQEYQMNIQAQEANIQKLENDLLQLSEENHLKQHKIEEERKASKQTLHTIEAEKEKLQRDVEAKKETSKELDHETKYLEDKLKDKQRHFEMTKSELVIMIQEKKQIEEENENVKVVLSSQDKHLQELEMKIHWLEGELSNKKKIIQSLDLQYQEVCRDASVKQNTCSQHFSAMDKENCNLKEEVLHYQHRYNDLKVKCEERENKFRVKVDRLEYELKKIVSTTVAPLLSKEDLLKSKHEMKNNLQNLAERSQYQKEMLLDMKSRKMERTEELLQAKYDTSELAVKSKNLRKLNMVSIENDERKALLKRLRALQKDNAKLAEESIEVVSDIDMCRMENTKLAAKIRDHEATISLLNDRLLEKEVRREENTKLAQRIKSYDDKLKTLHEEIAAKESFQQQSQSLADDLSKLKSKTEGLEKENNSLHIMIEKLNGEVEYLRKSSMKFGNASCCIELKTNLECMEKQMKYLEKNNNVLEERVQSSVGCEEKLKWIEQSLADRERDLSKAQKELEASKDKLKECEYQQKLNSQKLDEAKPFNSRVLEQPNVNVHVHLDPQQIVGIATKNQQHRESPSIGNANINEDKYYNQQPAVVSKVQSENNLQRQKQKIQSLMERNIVLEQQLHEQKSATIQSANTDEKQCTAHAQELRALEQVNRDFEARNAETSSEKMEIESLLKESETKIHSLEESDQKMKSLMEGLERDLKEMQDNVKLKDEEHQKETAELRKHIHSIENEDTMSLMSRIHDLNNKKEKNGALVNKLREDKVEMTMQIQRLERELQKTKDHTKELESFHLSVGEADVQDSIQQAPQMQQQHHQQQNGPTNVKSSQPAKAKVPIWLNNGSSSALSSTKKESVPDTLNTTSDTKPQAAKGKASKKSAGPIWLTSSSNGSTEAANKNNNNKAQCAEEDSDDDFLGIRASAKKKKQSTGNSSRENLDTSNRRNVPVRSKKTHRDQSSDDDSDEGLDKIFGRRGPPSRKPKAVAVERVEPPVSVVKKTSTERMVESFLNSKSQKKKNEDLDFLTLDDIPNNNTKQPKKLNPPAKSNRPVHNAEFFI